VTISGTGLEFSSTTAIPILNNFPGS